MTRNYQIVPESNQRGAPLWAVFPDGRRERIYELVQGSNAGAGAPFYVLESEVPQYQGTSILNSNVGDAATFESPAQYVAGTFRPAENKTLLDEIGFEYAPYLMLAGATYGIGSAAGAGGAAAGGSGMTAAEGAAMASGMEGAAAGGLGAGAGGTAAGIGTGGAEFTGGFTGTATGTPGFTGSAVGAPGFTASSGSAGTSLAPGFFASESAYPVFGGLTATAPSASTSGGGIFGDAAVGASGGAAGGGAAGGAGASTGILSNPQVLGAVGGAVLGGLSGSGSEKKTTTEEGIPDWLMPYARPALDNYTNQLQNYQIDPYGVMSDAMKEFQKTVSGQYLDPSTNKYLEDYYKLGAERIKSSLSPTFGHMQAFGAHSGYNEALARGLGDFATQLYGGNYARERDRQTAFTAGAPQFLAQSSTAAFTPYQQYLDIISGLGRKREEPYFTNPWGGILGGAMAGAQLGGLWG